MPEKPILANLPQHDDVAADLLQILDSSRGNKNLLMTKLVSYITRRDGKLFNHAYQLGREGRHDGPAKTG